MGGQVEQLLAVDGDRATGDRVVAPTHEHVRQRRLARAVRAHERVHLARAHLEVDAAQDLLPRDGGVQVRDLQHAHRPPPTVAHDHVGAVDAHVVDGDGLRRREALGLSRRPARTWSRGAGTRSRARLPRRRPRPASSPRASTRRRSRRTCPSRLTTQRRWPSTSKRAAVPGGDVVDRAHARRHAPALAIGSRCSSFSTTLRRNGATSERTGRRSNTSSKNPSTMRRSASSGGTPRVAR